MTNHMRLHGSAVGLGGCGLIVIGAPASGKSSLVLDLIAKGALLVADDAVDLTIEAGKIAMRCPVPIKSMIEVRGIGLLKVNTVEQANLDFVVDMDKPEAQRLPQPSSKSILGVEVPVIFGKGNANLGNALFCLLKGARIMPV